MTILKALREVKDNRKKYGKKYPLYSLLSLIIISKLCGYKSIKSAWNLSCELHYKQLHQLGFKKHYRPSYPIFLDALRSMDISDLEKCLSKISTSFLSKEKGGEAIHLGIDGKSLNGRVTANGDKYYLVSLFCKKLKGTFNQVKSKGGGDEVTSGLSIISKMDLQGKVITGDAMYSDAKLCQRIVDNRGNYVFTLKSNRQELLHQVKHIFRLNPFKEMERCHEEEMDKCHGRIEQRKIRVMNWPDHIRGANDKYKSIKQVAEITRYRNDLSKKGKETTEKAYIITSFKESEAGPEQLLKYNRDHWSIENNLHRTRDTLFGEDSQTIRVADSPQASSALSNLVIMLLNMAKKNNEKFKKMSLELITQTCARKIKIPIAMIT